MGSREGVTVVVVVEDQALGQFARKTLEALGYHRRKVHVRKDYPGGKGSGKQYVETKYQEEIVELRRYAGTNRALLLGTEADEQTVEQRTRQLDEQIGKAKPPTRGKKECVVYWIPKRHVETWGLHLTGTEVDEDRDCKNQARNTKIDWAEAGKNFVGEYRRQQEIKTLNSLKRAYRETERLPA